MLESFTWQPGGGGVEIVQHWAVPAGQLRGCRRFETGAIPMKQLATLQQQIQLEYKIDF